VLSLSTSMLGSTILNFLPIGDGGGCQNALSFLNTLRGFQDLVKECVAVVKRGSELCGACSAVGLRHITVGGGTLGRLAFELAARQVFERGTLCFTFFGPPMLGTVGYLNNVVGSAYSNLYYPDIRFWADMPLCKRRFRGAIDVYRKRLLRCADYWIFETPALRTRAVELCGFPETRVAVVPMAPSTKVAADRISLELQSAWDRQLPGGFRLLFLASAQPNKRLHTLPDVAAALARRNRGDIVFVTTMDERTSYCKAVLSAFEQRGLSHCISNLGPVRPDDVASAISCCQAMATFSRLESFSNNFVEAWIMGVPLVVSDRDWARGCCGEGAMYVDPERPEETAQSILTLADSNSLRRSFIDAGKRQLAKHPDPKTKSGLYLRELERARRLGPCSAAERRAISWPAD